MTSPKKFLSNPSSLVSDILSFGWNNIGKRVVEVASITKEVLSESLSVDDEERRELQGHCAPWENLGIEDKELEVKVSEQIYDIAKSDTHFLNANPDYDLFVFSMTEWLPTAIAALNKSPHLSKIRYQLVPAKIKEEDFWRNYFYRVTLIKRAYNLDESVPNQPLKIKNENFIKSVDNQIHNERNLEITEYDDPEDIGAWDEENLLKALDSDRGKIWE